MGSSVEIERILRGAEADASGDPLCSTARRHGLETPEGPTGAYILEAPMKLHRESFIEGKARCAETMRKGRYA